MRRVFLTGRHAHMIFDRSTPMSTTSPGFRALAPRERRILKLRYFGGLSQLEIAREVGLSQIQVSRLIRASLDRMRVALELGQGGRTTSLLRR